MIVFGLDTATPSTAVGLRLADGSTSHARDDPPAGAHPGHATRLLEMADELLARAGIAWSAVDRIAVGLGPGTFTGLRVGVSTARGLAQSLAGELVGVSSLQALAHAALAPVRTAPSAVLAVIDARRGEAFAAAYLGGDPRGPHELTAPAALAPDELPGVLGRAEHTAGGAAGSWLAVGDGALRYRETLESAGISVPSERSPLHQVSAVAVCELGVHAAPVGLHGLVPDYRRRSDAELALIAMGTATGPST